MNNLEETLKESRKIVIKVGSNVLSTEDGVVNVDIIEDIAHQIVELRNMGKDVILVSSGAGAFGVGALKKWARRKDINYKQALCAIGQTKLIEAYGRTFGKYNIQVAQMLLTREDFVNDDRLLHIRNTMFTLIDEGVVPIINENDTVSVEEIKIGDNDSLSALTANLWNSDTLIILSDIDGLFNKNPKIHKDAMLVEEITNLDEQIKQIDIDGISTFGTGGIKTKINAAGLVAEYGIPMIMLNGRRTNVIIDGMKGLAKGTIFNIYRSR